jgi:hypothetical protein
MAVMGEIKIEHYLHPSETVTLVLSMVPCSNVFHSDSVPGLVFDAM